MFMRILMDIGLVTIGAIIGVCLICIAQAFSKYDRDMEMYNKNPKDK